MIATSALLTGPGFAEDRSPPHPATEITANNPQPLSFQLSPDADVTFYGYIKADAISDRGYDLGDDTYPLVSIGLPIGPTAGDFKTFTLRETRLGFDVSRGDLFAKFEGDFYGADDRFRLRHAYVEWPSLLVGQTWTNFMPVFALADTVDFQGPAGIPFARVPQVRLIHDLSKGLQLTASIEQDPASGDDLALTGAVKYRRGDMTLKAAGLVRDFTSGGVRTRGWGLNLAAVFSPWRNGRIKANVTRGSAITDIYAASMSGPALYLNGSPVESSAFTLEVGQRVTDRLLVALTMSQLYLDEAVGSNTKDLKTLHLSAFYDLAEKSTLMIEYFRGSRTQGDQLSFDTNRIQIAYKFTF